MLGARLAGADGALRISVPRIDSRGIPVDARGGLTGFAPTSRLDDVTARLRSIVCDVPRLR